VIDFASRHEYAMIIGDFNPDDFIDRVKQSENLTYEADLALFREAGYSVANADKFGIFTTIPLSKIDYPCDNIIVSPNIKIHKVGLTRRDWMNDHAALWADVEIC
jgi:endonuclease/exonuclease/phosphatase family metal-dependent hydrolase